MIIQLTGPDGEDILINTQQILTVQRVNRHGVSITRIVMIGANPTFNPNIFVSETLGEIMGRIAQQKQKMFEDHGDAIATAMVEEWDFYRKSDKGREV